MEEKKEKQKIEVNINQKQQIEAQLVGQIKPKNGHKVFAINKKTKEISLAKFDSLAIIRDIRQTVNKRITVEEGFFYISALNEKNALKKFNKIFN